MVSLQKLAIGCRCGAIIRVELLVSLRRLMSPEGLLKLGLTLDSVSPGMDLIDVEGGPVGLTATSTVARQFHTAVFFDNKRIKPQELRDAARRDILARCEMVQFADVGVTGIGKKNDSHFKLIDVNGNEWNFRKVLLAVGSVKKFPDIAGFDGLSGKMCCLVEKPATRSVAVEFTDGSSKDGKFLPTTALCRKQGNFVKQLGLATTMLGNIQAKEPY
ncbi:hypothetical protein C8R45DRAFT_1222231 [Mycena sanguinolenta]|nr:hypothetical protein C8R45DRAFT_1222231 [Mycena sanguinolenta]